ncbi:MAG: hypothetical protein K9G70_04275 [Prolixibacteraceae bacterium]|nr:hypothetical protein [Prolixibacteraceae bacterium]
MKAKQILFAIIGLAFVFQSCDEDEPGPSSIKMDFNVNNVSAFNGEDGAVEAIISDVEEPIYYYWNTGDTTSSLSGLRAGVYTLQLTYGANGQGYAEKDVEITEPEAQPLDVSFEVVDASKYAKPWGKVEVIIEGGTPPYKVEWSNGATSLKIEELFAGNYTVKIEDSSSPKPITAEAAVYVGQAGFVCGQDSIIDVDGNYYGTVELGGMCWTVENLKTENNPAYPDSIVPIDGRYCKGTYCSQAEGSHYTWSALMNGQEGASGDYDQVQGIAPEGWHIPTKKEWQDLQEWLRVEGNGGEGTNAYAKVMGENSPSGFNMLATGNWGYGIYEDPGIAAFWTSTPYSGDRAESVYLVEDAIAFFQRFNFSQRPQEYGLNVRLVKDRD